MRSTKKISFNFFLILLASFFSASAYADAGLPMLIITLPLMFFTFIPIVLIEGLILLNYLPISKKLAFQTAFISNLISTFIGIPITWMGLVALEFAIAYSQYYLAKTFSFNLDNPFINSLMQITIYSPWLGPNGASWIVPAAAAFLLIPFFFVSWFIEYQISKKILKSENPILIKKAVLIGNLFSYAMLEIITVVYIIARLI